MFSKTNGINKQNLFNKYKILRNQVTLKKRTSKVENDFNFFDSKFSTLWKGIKH